MAAQLAAIPEGNRLAHIYPTEFWTEQEQTVVKREVEIDVEVVVLDEVGDQVKRQEKKKVMRDEVQFVNEDYVKWVKKGDTRSAQVIKVRLMKKIEPDVWKTIEPHYMAWKKNEEIPENGTALENWPLIKNKRQIAELKLLAIRTVEDLAEVPDSMLQNLGMGGRALRDKAKAYVSAKNNEAQFAVLLTQRDETIGKQQAQIDELTRNLAEITRNLPQKRMPKDIAKSGD